MQLEIWGDQFEVYIRREITITKRGVIINRGVAVDRRNDTEETPFENDGAINRVRDPRGLIGVSDERQFIECQEDRRPLGGY